ncbi:hypothetical protein AAGW05_08490 [Arthrobacter sp. LAPM80]|uniref:hypothetical protein n=1 Tax=Arthrobacter sp. LAPM80 TaxID=3141788 RepID=UPI00398B6CE3
MPAVPSTRRRVELVLVPLVAAFCMAVVIGTIVLNREGSPCPSPSWDNHVSLSLSGSVADAAHASAVTACTGAECVPAPPAFVMESTGNTSVLSHQLDGSWLMTVGAQPPSAVSFRVYDHSGNVLAAQTTALNWTRVSGDERCGGRMAGINVVLAVP